jgi:hypothetical protein
MNKRILKQQKEIALFYHKSKYDEYELSDY